MIIGLPSNQWAPEDVANDACSPVWTLFGSLGRAVANMNGPLADLGTALRNPRGTDRRQRRIFPLGLPDVESVGCELRIGGECLRETFDYVNGVIIALNWMSGVRPPLRLSSRATAGQSAALRTIFDSVGSLVQR